jgi:hypothetical protein
MALTARFPDKVEVSALSSGLRPSSSGTRRRFLQASFASVALGSWAHAALAAQTGTDAAVAAARAGLARAGKAIADRDIVGVADFARPSRVPRFHLVDLASGKVDTLLVAHGRGSDPERTGWLRSFSNRPGSEATSQGCYVTGDYYLGQHGRSIHLRGLDPTNDNAEARKIVIHEAWYVGPGMVDEHGKLGCSEGCFAVSRADLARVLDRLRPGRLLVATKL